MSVIRWLVAHSVLVVGAVFLLLVVTTYWPGRRARFERDAMIPLRDDLPQPPHHDQARGA